MERFYSEAVGWVSQHSINWSRNFVTVLDSYSNFSLVYFTTRNSAPEKLLVKMTTLDEMGTWGLISIFSERNPVGAVY